MLSRFAFSLTASTVDADGLVALVALKRPSLRGSTLDFTCFRPDRRQKETFYRTKASVGPPQQLLKVGLGQNKSQTLVTRT
jgi:hypothetical protein